MNPPRTHPDDDDADEDEPTEKYYKQPLVDPFAAPELENLESERAAQPTQFVITPKIIEKQDDEEDDEIIISDEAEDEEERHQHFFSDQVHFVRPKWSLWWLNAVAMIAFAVDMSNLVSFPNNVSNNGGAAYVVIYIIVIVCFVYPMLYLEVIVGQFFQTGMIGIWGISPIFRGLGAGIFYITFIIIAYVPSNVMYATLLMWDAAVSLKSGNLPWATCDNDWNTCRCKRNRIPECLELELANKSRLEDPRFDAFRSPASEYFIGNVLKLWKTKLEDPLVITDITENGDWSKSYGFWNDQEGVGQLITLHSLLILAIYILILIMNMVRLKYVGYFYTFTAAFPMLILSLMFCRGATLEGAMTGIVKYMMPDFLKMLDISVWYGACQSAFYSVGSGLGCHIMMSSFNPLVHNVRKDAIICICVDVLMSFLGCLVAFMFVGHVHTLQRTAMPDVFPGDNFVFISLAEALTTVSGSSFFACVYYFMIAIFCADTQLVALHCLSFSLWEEYRRKYPDQTVGKGIFLYTVWGFAFCITLLSTTRGGYWVFCFLTERAFGVSSFIFMLLEIILFSWVWGIEEVCAATITTMGYRPHMIMRISWKFLLPALLLVCGGFIVVHKIVFQKNDPVVVLGQHAPPTTEKIGKLFPWIPIVLMIIYGSYVYCRVMAKSKKLSCLQVLMLLISPEYEHDSIRENIKNAKRLTWRHYKFLRYEEEHTDDHRTHLLTKWSGKLIGVASSIKGKLSHKSHVHENSTDKAELGTSAKGRKNMTNDDKGGNKKKQKKDHAQSRKEDESAWEMWEKIKPHVELEFEDEGKDEPKSPTTPKSPPSSFSSKRKSRQSMAVGGKRASRGSNMTPIKSAMKKKSVLVKGNNKVQPR